LEPKVGTPSIWEVAKSAGVSVATISRVLNGKGPVRANTRDRVLAAIADLGYVPHSAARSLSTRKSMSVGVLLPDIYGEFFSELIRGIDQVAKRAGYHVLVSGSHSDPREVQALLHALHGRVDGIVIMAPSASNGDGGHEPIVPKGVPWIAVGRGFADGGMAIQIDNEGGARSVVHHLADLGHHRIAMVTGPEENFDAADRLAGYRRALSERSIEFDPTLLFAGDFREESGHRAAHGIVAMNPRPTAIFAANDAMAIGCLAALSELGH
jgi:LacI family transcriptional regulator